MQMFNKIKNLSKKINQNNNGTSAIELALIMPVLLLFMVGTLDLGAAFVRKMEISNAAKAGVQYATVRKPLQGDLTNIRGAVVSALGDTVNESTTINAELYCMCQAVKQACTVTCADENVSAFVNISVSENFTTPFFNYDWFISEFPLSESTTIQLN